MDLASFKNRIIEFRKDGYQFISLSEAYKHLKNDYIRRKKYADIDISIFEGGGVSENIKYEKCKLEEYRRFEKEYIPNRLLEASKVVPKKINLYDQLKKNKFIWNLAMILARISRFL
jgi:hypothetical protein